MKYVHGKEVAGDAKRKMDAGAAAAAERTELLVARAAKRAANSKRPLCILSVGWTIVVVGICIK